MIISYKHKFIILSVPKTGSTAMQHLFTKEFADDVKCIFGNMPDDNGLRKHITAKELRWKIKGFKDFKKIAVVRNPYDYVVSWYAYTNRLPKDNKRSSFGKNFNKFVKTMRHVWYNYPEPWRKKTWHISQIDFLTNKRGDMIVDEIIKFEDMKKNGIPTTFAPILEYTFKSENVIKNTSQRSEDYREYYDDETQEIVSKAMEIDIKTFGYEY